MQQILNFIITNYELIISGVLLVVSVIILILRKRPVNALLFDIFIWCLRAVCVAEQTGLKGSSKLNYAVSVVQESLKSKYPDIDFFKYKDDIVSFIEAILSSPQKK